METINDTNNTSDISNVTPSIDQPVLVPAELAQLYQGTIAAADTPLNPTSTPAESVSFPMTHSVPGATPVAITVNGQPMVPQPQSELAQLEAPAQPTQQLIITGPIEQVPGILAAAQPAPEQPAVTQPVPQPQASFDDDLLYAEDEKGNKVPDAVILAEASTPKIIEFRAGGKKHKAEVLLSQVDWKTRRAPTLIAQRIMQEHNAADIDDDELEELDEKEKAAMTQRLIEANDAVETSEEFRLAQAAIACAIVVRDKQGRARVSVPHFRENLTPRAVVDDHIFGRPFVIALANEVSRFFSL